jgi:hypothetical protein
MLVYAVLRIIDSAIPARLMFTKQPASRDSGYAADSPLKSRLAYSIGGHHTPLPSWTDQPGRGLVAEPQQYLPVPGTHNCGSEIGNLQQRGKTVSISSRAIVDFDDPGPP